MPQHRFQTNEEYNFGIDGWTEAGFRMLAYSGNLGGGTLKLKSRFDGGIVVPVSDGELNATMTDDNGDVIQQVTFQTTGTIVVELTGATTPDVTVVVQ